MTTQTETGAVAFTRQQQQMVAAVWATYALFYLGRLNVSPALSPMAEALEVSRAQIGILGTVFFWSYALGHFFSGELGNHFSPRKLIALGLLVIAIVNSIIPLQSSLLVIALLWMVNGVAQSTGWGPMTRILSERLEPGQRKRISTYFPMSYLFGAAATWAIAGWLVAVGGWQAAFRIPGLVLFVVLVVWWLSGVDAPISRTQAESYPRWAEIRAELSDLLPILSVAALFGFVHVGGNIWLPTYFKDSALFPEEITGLMAGIIPLAGILGMFIAGRLLERIDSVFRTMKLLVSLGGMCMFGAVILPLRPEIVLVGATMMLLSGVSAILLSSVPILLSRQGRASSVAGSITAVANIGGGLAGAVVGGIEEQAGWNAVFGAWLLCLVAVIGVLHFSRGR